MQINICIISDYFAELNNLIYFYVNKNYKMLKLATDLEASNILASHFDTIKLIMNESLAELNSAMGAISVPTNERAKCSLLHSIAVEKAIRQFIGKDGIQLVKSYQSIQIIFNGRLVGRIKKVNKNNMSRNAKTNRNDLILSQYTGLFSNLTADVPATTFIELGYIVDHAWTKFERLVVVCRLKDSIKWLIDFTGAEQSIIPMANAAGLQLLIKEETQIKLKKAE